LSQPNSSSRTDITAEILFCAFSIMANLPLAMRLMLESKKQAAHQAFEDAGAPPAKRPRVQEQMGQMQGMQAMQMQSTGSTMPGMSMQAQAAQAAQAAMMRPSMGSGNSRSSPAQPRGMQNLPPPAAAVTAARSAIQAEAQAKADRSPEEVKQSLINHGCVIEKNISQKDLKNYLQELESQIARAKFTKTLPKHDEQKLISSFREGYAPGPEGLLRLLEAGGDPNTISAGAAQSGFAAGMSPLLAAASWGKVDELRLLLHAGADIHAKAPPLENSILHVVAGGDTTSWGMDKAFAMTRLIIELEPNLLLVKNNRGKSPQDWAKHEKKPKLAAFIANYLG